MEETEQRLAAARAKRATAQALIDAQKQLVDQADKEERALKEQLDAERTSAYEGKFVRGQSINGTVRAVKYGEAYISWADGVDYAIKFEHLDMCLERYEDWAAGVLQDWDCAPSGACLDGPEAPPPLVEVREYLAPEASPSADDYEAAAAAAVGIRWATEFAGGAGAGEDALANDSQLIPDHVLLQPEAVSPLTDARVNRWIEVYWAGDKVWYKGRVVGQKIVNGAIQLSVKYVDGEQHDEALQDEPFAGDGVPPDDRKPWYWRFAEPPNTAALPEFGAELESAAVPPPPEFQLCRELSEACDTVATPSSAETPPRAATPKRSLPVTFCIGNKAKKPKTDVDAEAEFEFPENQNNAKVLELLAAVAASQRCL